MTDYDKGTAAPIAELHALAAQLCRIEGQLAEVLRELHGRRKRGNRRARSVAARATRDAELRYKPTELQMAAARRALARR